MEKNPDFHIDKGRAVLLIGAAGALVVVAACSSHSDNSRGAQAPTRPTAVISQVQPETSKPQPVSPTETDKSENTQPHSSPAVAVNPSPPKVEAQPTQDACEAPYVPAFPGSRYKQSNADDMQKQLNALAVAHSPSAAVTFSDIANAEFIGLNGLADPAYAKAFTYANQHTGAMPTAQQLLDKNFSGPKCVTGDQLQEVSDLYGTLVDGLAPKAGRQMSASAQAAYAGLRSAYHSFVETYHEQLGH